MNRFFTLLCAASCLTAVGQYQVGDVGPAGGWVFYVDAENQFEDWDYLEAWPHTFSFFQLLACDYSPYLSSSELGTGENNTMVFTSNDDTFSAFDFAVLFDGGSRNDWFLPSKSELEALNASSVSALINSGEGYSAASSSIFNGCHWWTYDINNGWGIEDDLYSWEWVLPIRSFQTADDGIVCGQGTIWDEASQTCIPDNPSDLNYDGCVDVNDFMGHLAAFGSGCEEGVAETPWQCGDPLEYQGYDYATVLIGEQCWFAENLRNENYENGDPIQSGLSDSEWSSALEGASAVYGISEGCEDQSPTINACNPVEALDEYGRLYNWWAVNDSLHICPTGWHVPSFLDWSVLVEHLGGTYVAAAHLKTANGWYAEGNGTNSSGFSALPGGYRTGNSGMSAGDIGRWWTSTNEGNYEGKTVTLQSSSYGLVSFGGSSFYTGHSVRCIKDSE